MAALSDRLKFLRTSAGLSQQELAKQTGINKSNINMYERGDREPNFEKLEILSDYFNVDMDYLLGKSSIPNRAAALREKGISIDDLPEELLEGSQPLSDLDIRFIQTVHQLSPESQQRLLGYMESLLEQQK